MRAGSRCHLNSRIHSGNKIFSGTELGRNVHDNVGTENLALKGNREAGPDCTARTTFRNPLFPASISVVLLGLLLVNPHLRGTGVGGPENKFPLHPKRLLIGWGTIGFVSQGSWVLTPRNNAQGSAHLGPTTPTREALAGCGGGDGALVRVSSAAGEELHLGWGGREQHRPLL